MYLVTGGAGFIGSALVHALANESTPVVNVDKLTYAANPASLAGLDAMKHYHFEQVDVCDGAAMREIFARYAPDVVIHLAAESHVDRSIDAPAEFVRTNVLGTFTMLAEARRYVASLPDERAREFRFVHVSTDEVFGSLGPHGLFTESSRYDPSSPYSATKASGDHLARAWHRTYGFPAIVTYASNNFGPRQLPEKLIPRTVLHALARNAIDVYGDGRHVRDWIYVEDHVEALRSVATRGRVGESYAIAGGNERTNLDVVNAICDLVDELDPSPGEPPRRSLIRFVSDRPGHDFRYALDSTRVQRELGWQPRRTFEDALAETVRWYIEHPDWWQPLVGRSFSSARIGLGDRA